MMPYFRDNFEGHEQKHQYWLGATVALRLGCRQHHCWMVWRWCGLYDHEKASLKAKPMIRENRLWQKFRADWLEKGILRRPWFGRSILRHQFDPLSDPNRCRRSWTVLVSSWAEPIQDTRTDCRQSVWFLGETIFLRSIRFQIQAKVR